MNLCLFNGLYSVCGAKFWQDQKDCEHAEKSKLREQRIFYCFDGRCDCRYAQNGARGDYVKNKLIK